MKDLVADCGQRVYPVGRLDLNSEGLLILTNDGELTNRLTHPSHDIPKVYKLWVSNYYAGADKKLEQPMEMDGRMTSPAGVRLLSVKDAIATLEVTIHEGRNRQIRRLCEAAELTVTRLQRIREGSLTLGDLPVGKWRHLTDEEVYALYGE